MTLNGFPLPDWCPLPELFSPAFLADGLPALWWTVREWCFADGFVGAGVFSSINWLWVVGAVASIYCLVSAMGRRQTRLTEVLRKHVQKHKDAHMPTETANETEDSA
ncbi:hypothetical protein [Rhodopirellula sallentina]|uniref:Uncharacterized protein n=1 Tax=Rhodopirellula sallentina SM41 TaxID=1263870 RepID=M5U4D4_9BACT|nr:hypothetical protein [Rhodopirellula sallentina]EMI56310.1 hypothetical protein RSSM_02268 [Rhodopirellula sallentina SM41]